MQYRWSHFYASGREILGYLKGVAAKYKLERFLRFGHKLSAAQWNEETKQWHLSFDLVDEQGNKHGETEKVADVVIQGMGGLSRWDWPSIEGIHDFKVRVFASLRSPGAPALTLVARKYPQGTKYHSAAYPAGPEAEQGKTVAVIGSGSSSIQIVPALQPYAKRVDNFVRGQAWIATPFASTELLKRSPDASNYAFTEEEKTRFEQDPEYYHEFRLSMEREVRARSLLLLTRDVPLAAAR